MGESVQETRIIWLDFAKAIAILAVMVDHTHVYLYNNLNIAFATYFSVSLFILVMGITTYMSESKHMNVDVWSRIKNRLLKIICPYMVATLLYSLAIDRMFDLKSFLVRLLYCNASDPLYYVSLYVQLVFANIILYQFVRICDGYQYGWLYKALVGIIIIVVSSVTTLHSNILGIYGGGGRLFGGTYLILSYIGMVMSPLLFKKWKTIVYVIVFVVTSILWIFYYRFIGRDVFHIESGFPFGGGINPPGITLMPYSVVILLWCFSIVSICEKKGLFVIKIIDRVKIIGENSLYVFLYHKLILDYFLEPYTNIENIWTKRLFYYLCMIGIPIIGIKLYLEVKKRYIQIRRKSENAF